MAGIRRAYAVAVNVVRVELTDAYDSDGINAGTQPSNWGVAISGGAALTVVSAADVPSLLGFGIDITLWPKLSAGTSYVVTARSTLQTAAGGTYTTPSTWTVAGLDAAPAADARLKRLAGYDLRLPTLQTPGTTETAGVYQMSAGDYALWSGRRAAESDWLRRLRTAPGGFAWLPNYGVGLEVKAMATPARQLDAKRRIADQIGQEPNVRAVAPRITYVSGGIVLCELRVELDDGEVVTASDQLTAG